MKTCKLGKSGMVSDQIDAAYAAKYRRYASIILSINSPTARAAVIRLVPR